MNKYFPEHYKFKADWILYEDKDILVLNKPAGLLSVPGRLEQHKICLHSIVSEAVGISLFVVHRLDMDTSGVMLFAKSKYSLSALNKQFRERKVFKVYHALCKGILEKNCGVIYLPMRCDWDNRPRQIVDLRNGKPCHTQWKKLKQLDDYVYVELIPHTGRTHQLRVHMKMLGHSILGDNLYYDNRVVCNIAAKRLMLNASLLRFTHPVSNKVITVTKQADAFFNNGIVREKTIPQSY